MRRALYRAPVLALALGLSLLLGAGAARAGKGNQPREAALLAKAQARLQRGPTLSPSLARSATRLLERAARPAGQVFHYAPLERGSALTVYDSRTIKGGFAAYSLTLRAPSASGWDVQLIREDSGRSLKDVARAATRLSNGRTLEVSFSAGADGRRAGSYSLRDAAGRTLVRSGNLEALQAALAKPVEARRIAAALGVPAGELTRRMTSFAPFGF